jgi:phage terminase large subunit
MATLRIPTAPVFRPLLAPARYKGAYGGRGSGKSHFFGELMVEECLMVAGTLAVCIREVQKSLMQSSKRLIESKIQQLGVGDQFKFTSCCSRGVIAALLASTAAAYVGYRVG